jgi:hypothetical protein
LSLSGTFKRAFISAWRTHQSAWRQQYSMHSRCDEKTDNDKKHDQILTFYPIQRASHHPFWSFQFYWLMSKMSGKNLSPEQQYRTSIYEQLQSAGTSLNYFVKYHDGDINDINASRLDVDFERLVLINSSFYSEVKGQQR